MRQISYTIATKLESVDTEFEFIVTDLWILDENSAGIYYLRWQVNMKLVRIGINSGIELSCERLNRLTREYWIIVSIYIISIDFQYIRFVLWQN